MALTRIANIASTIPDDSIANVKMANIVQSKNIIINGDMSISQRATSATGIGDGDSGYHTVDRFKFVESGSPSCEFTQTQSTDVPTGQGFASSLKMDCTTADASLGADDFVYINTSAEGQNLQYLKKGTASAESVTLSFWVKSSKTGTHIFEIIDRDNTRAISKSYTVSSADTWEQKEITFAGDTTGALDNDNARSFELIFWLGAGANFSSGTLQTSWGSRTNANDAVGQVNLADSTSNDWYVTGIQMEAGSVATDFEVVPYGVNLRRCLRYFYPIISISDTNSLNAFGYYYSASNIKFPVRFPTEMRSVPTLEQDIDTNALRFYRDSTYDGQSGNFLLDGEGSGRYVSFYNSTDASGTAGQAGQLYKYSPTQADSYIWLSAEL